MAFSFILLGGMVSASTQFITDVSGNGEITIDQHGHKDSSFSGSYRIGTGTLNFDQDIDTNYGHFSNGVKLNGQDLRLDNYAGEQYVAGHREISFSQQLYAGESSDNGNEAKSTQSFNPSGTRYIKQKVQANPTGGSSEVEDDRLDMWTGEKGQGGVMNNKNMNSAFGGRASLSQKGRMHADYDFASQWSNNEGSSIESWNNDNWMNFEQSMTFKE